MPTQHDFRAAATALRTLAVTAGAGANAVNDIQTNVGMSGGTATPIIDAAMNAAFLNASSVRIASNAAADEFERRAEICAEYTYAMQRWRADMNQWQYRWNDYLSQIDDNPNAIPPGYQPARPTRTPLWVEEG